MTLYFITGNANKFEEVKKIIPSIEQMDLDLPEIQELDSKAVIKEKLLEALNHHEGEFLVEDTSLFLDCIPGLPGPLVKWFEFTLDNEGMYELCEKYNNFGASAKVIIGYAKNVDEIYYFEGVVKGTIKSPRGENGFGWDKILCPEGHERTFAEMSAEEKNEIGMRQLATRKLKEFLD